MNQFERLAFYFVGLGILSLVAFILALFIDTVLYQQKELKTKKKVQKKKNEIEFKWPDDTPFLPFV